MITFWIIYSCVSTIGIIILGSTIHKILQRELHLKVWAKLGKQWAEEIYKLSKSKDIKVMRTAPTPCDNCGFLLPDNTLVLIKEIEGCLKIIRCPYCQNLGKS